MTDMKKLRKELEFEYADLKEFGVTEEELESIYQMCGLKLTLYSRFKVWWNKKFRF